MAESNISPPFEEFNLMYHKGQKRIPCIFSVAVDSISWSAKDSSAVAVTETIRVDKILICEVKEHDKQSDDALFVLHYVNVKCKGRGVIVRKASETFSASFTACERCNSFCKDLILKAETRRPKSMLVFLNPNSGSRNTVKLYEKMVAPLFALAGISTNVIVTEHANHPSQVLQDYDLSTIDTIVAVGGDGTFNLVANGLLDRVQKDAGIDLHGKTCHIQSPAAALVMIPAGTGNGLPLCTNYTIDVESCTLIAILGHRIKRDVSMVYSGEEFLTFTHLLVGYGMFSSIIYTTEKLRWMRKFRYVVLLPKMLSNMPNIPVEVDYLPHDATERKRFRETVSSLMIFPMLGNIHNNRNLSGEILKLTCLKRSTLKQRISLYRKIMDLDESAYSEDFVTAIDVSEFYMKATEDWAMSKLGKILDVDGEAVRLPAAEFGLRLFPEKLEMIGINNSIVPSEFFNKRTK